MAESEIAVLAAKLKVDGGDAFRGEMEKSTKKVDELSRHIKGTRDQLNEFGKTNVKVAMRGADAFSGKLKVLGKTSYDTTAAVKSASKAVAASGDVARGAGIKLTGMQNAARGAAAAFGGLGKLGPVVGALASPVGIVSAAIGGMAVAIKKLKEANKNLDLESLTGQFEEMDKKLAEIQAGGSALVRGIIDGASPQALTAIVASAQSMARLAADEAIARKETDAFLEKQKKLAADIASEQEKLNAVPVSASTRDQRKAMQDWIDDAERQQKNLTTRIEQTWAALVPQAKVTAEIKSEADKLLEVENKRKKTAKEILTEDEKLLKIRRIISRLQDSGYATKVGGGEMVSTGRATGAGAGVMAGAMGGVTAGVGNRAAAMLAANKSAAQGMFGGGLAGSVMQGGASGGVAGAGIALLSASEGFQNALKPVNELLQSFANALGATVQPMVPTLQALSDTLSPFLQAMQPVVELMFKFNPAFAGLTFAAKALGDAMLRVTRVFTHSVLGVLKAINRALDKMHISWKPLESAIDSLRKSLKDTADAADQTAANLGAIMPEGYKLLENRVYNASPGTSVYHGPNGTVSGGGLIDGAYDSSNAALRVVNVGAANTSGSSGNGATASGASASGGAGIVIQHAEFHGVKDLAELHDKLTRMTQRGRAIYSGRMAYGTGRG